MRSTRLQVIQWLGTVRTVAEVSLHVIFDGDCAFCSTCARFLESRLRSSAAVRPWQRVELEALGLTEDECAAALQCVDTARKVKVSGHRAVAMALRACRFPWSVIGRLIEWRVLSPLGAVVYRTVANNRHRLPGGTPACKLSPER